MARPVTHGPALNVEQAAAYIGWEPATLRTKWRKHPLLAAAAVKDGRHLTFLQMYLDRYLDAFRVVRGTGVAPTVWPKAPLQKHEPAPPTA